MALCSGGICSRKGWSTRDLWYFFWHLESPTGRTCHCIFFTPRIRPQGYLSHVGNAAILLQIPFDQASRMSSSNQTQLHYQSQIQLLMFLPPVIMSKDTGKLLSYTEGCRFLVSWASLCSLVFLNHFQASSFNDPKRRERTKRYHVHHAYFFSESGNRIMGATLYRTIFDQLSDVRNRTWLTSRHVLTLSRAARKIQLKSFRKFQLDDYIMLFTAVRAPDTSRSYYTISTELG